MKPKDTTPLPLSSGSTPELLLSKTEGRDVIASRAAARALTSVRTWKLACNAKPRDYFTVQRVAPGAEVSPGMVLVGKASPRDQHLLSRAELVLDAIRGVQETARDTSLRCPHGVRGTVESVDVEPACVTVTIRVERALAVGDVLRAEGGSLAVVGAIEDELPGGGDLLWPGLSGRHRIDKMACAEDRLEARGHGPYSLVTQQPLAREPGGVQRVGRGAVEALLARGARATVHEMVTVKSDDKEGRYETYASIVNGEPAALPKKPVSTRSLEALLRALGFVVDLEEEAPSIALATTETIRALAPHVVTEQDPLNKDELSPKKGGLFCEEIFGRLGSPQRARRFGRVELAEPVLPPWATETAAILLDMPVADVHAVVDHKAVLPRHEGLNEPPPGAAAVRDELALLDVRALASAGGARGEIARALLDAGLRPQDLVLDAWPVLPPDLRPSTQLDATRFATADVNLLYRRVISRSNRLRKLKELDAPAVILRNEAQLLQEAVAHLVENGHHGMKWVVGDAGRRVKSLVDAVRGPSSPLALVRDGKSVDFAGAATVVVRADLPPDRAMIPREAALEIYRPWLYAALGTAGGRSVKSAERLVTRRDRRALAALTRMPPLVLLPENDAPRVTSVEMVPWDEPAVGLSPRTLELLGLAPGDAVTFHVPIDPEAVAEARTRLRRLVATEPVAEDDGWLSRAARTPKTKLGSLLYSAALRRERDAGQSAVARLLLGRRP